MKKIEGSRTAIALSLVKQKILLIIGILIIGFFSFALIGFLLEPVDTVFLCLVLFFMAIGFFLLYLSSKRKRFMNTYRTYISILSVDPTGSISNLAVVTHTSEVVVKRKLNTMIHKKFFGDAYINEITNCVIISSLTGEKVNNIEKDPKEYISFKCTYCGGITRVIKGKVGECEYCRARLQEEVSYE